MKGRGRGHQKMVPPFPPHLFRKKVKIQYQLEKQQRNPGLNIYHGRNDGRLMYGARRRTSYSSGRRPCRHRTHWASWAVGDTGFLCSGTIWWSSNLNSQFSFLKSLPLNLIPQIHSLQEYTSSDPHAVSSYNPPRRAGRKHLHWPEPPRRQW